MTRDHFVVAINQDRDIEIEGLDAVGDLSDLLPCCGAAGW
jgi:hypothetical protein